MFHFSTVQGQMEGVNWCFGQRNAVSFATGLPQTLSASGMKAPEGCSSVSDKLGNLRFYSNGHTVWNRNGQVMPNGGGLTGDSLASQSVLAVPQPQSTTLYYLFTVASFGQGGLYYHVIDMAADNGKGAVTVKNQLLLNPVTEKLSAVAHANGTDYWVLTHEWNTNRYAAFQITPSGLQTTAVFSSVGPSHTGQGANAKGYMKASPDGTRIALAIKFDYMIVVSDFNDATGQVSNAKTVDLAPSLPYGVEFSPNSQLLYATSNKFVAGGSRVNTLHQMNGQAATQNALRASLTTVGTYTESGIFTPENPLGAIQVAPDGKIYIARVNDQWLSGVTNPNTAGAACGFTQFAYGPLTGPCGWGIPTFVQSFFIPPVVDLAFVNYPCEGQPVRFIGRSNLTPDAWYWKFNDSLAAPADTSNQQNPTYRFRTPGVHSVWVYITYQGVRDSAMRLITVLAKPTNNLGPDRTLCFGDTAVIDAGNPGLTYIWSNTQSSQVIRVTTPSNLSVRMLNGACDTTFFIRIKFLSPPQVELEADTALCGLSIYTLEPTVILPVNWPAGTTPSYLWSDGSTLPKLEVTLSGYYHVKVGVGNCLSEDSINIWLRFVKPPNLGPDTAVCAEQGANVRLGTSGFLLYRWGYEGPAGLNIRNVYDSAYLASEVGLYFIETIDSLGCEGSDTVRVRDGCIRKEIPTAFSPNADGRNDLFKLQFTNLGGYELQIYDRMGHQVYDSRDPNQGWDGNYLGKPCPEGGYVWVLRYVNSEQIERTERGTLTLIR
jgi:gliding motility-associated-like protein